MKWEIITDKLSKAGLSWGCSSVRSNYAARGPRIQARIVTKRPTTQAHDAQLSAPALHLPTPMATG